VSAVDVAVTTALPRPVPVTVPEELTIAIPLLDDDHDTVDAAVPLTCTLGVSAKACPMWCRLAVGCTDTAMIGDDEYCHRAVTLPSAD